MAAFFPLSFGTGCVQTVAIIGPIFGFLLGSLCAKLYVDIGFVNLGKRGVLLFIYSFYLGYYYFLNGNTGKYLITFFK